MHRERCQRRVGFKLGRVRWTSLEGLGLEDKVLADLLFGCRRDVRCVSDGFGFSGRRRDRPGGSDDEWVELVAGGQTTGRVAVVLLGSPGGSEEVGVNVPFVFE